MPDLRLLFLVVIFYLTSCGQFNGGRGTGSTKQIAVAPVFGWLDGRCFATLEDISEPGQDILVVGLDDPQSISNAQVVGPATAEACGPLSSDRRERNEAEGLKFYTVTSEQSFGLAIGVMGRIYQSNIKDGVARVVLSGEGVFSQFTHCATGDGISFDVWASAPYEQAPVWTGFYYLGYDVERNCP